MSKYEQAKYLVKTKARIVHYCCTCGKLIEAGNYYFKEKLDMMKPPRLVLKEFCEKCGSRSVSVNG